MSLKTLTCTEASCDDCGSDCWDDSDYGTPHFPSPEQALKSLAEDYEWSITDERQVCRACANKRVCEAEGHDWREWLDGVAKYAGTQIRWCDREGCYVNEERPIRPGQQGGA